ncbi:MAG: hypothetical protein CMI90_00425 [Pelagibacteraceae bacterium]|nr:hypothetical protein [Pelagibacteraceae bacterium]
MLVNSFDTKFGNTAKKYELLDNTFIKLIKKNKSFERIFTSVSTNKNLEHKINLRSDITGQVLNSIINQNLHKNKNFYYMGDVFKTDIFSSQVKQFREHGIEIINENNMNSFLSSMKILIQYLNLIVKKEFIFVFTDPSIKKTNEFILTEKKTNSKITNYVKNFKKLSKSILYEVNLEKNFFSKNYHKDIFFYVYSSKSKKILVQGGAYSYKKNNLSINGFGFSCNIDYWVELI